MYNNYAQQPQYRPNMYQQAMLKGHPVSSLEEARATGIDFDGSIFFFPDIANKRIYTKQINVDGTSSLNMYQLTAIQEPVTPSMENFITRQEFEEALKKLLPQTQEAQTQASTQTNNNFKF